jgi:uncharacterized protein
MSKLKIVLDTNIILSSIFPTSPYQPILRSVANDVFDMHVTTAILLEYEEKISDIFGQNTSKLFLDFCRKTPNVKATEVYINWRMIYADPDDDKFVDCAIAANADYLVTNDKHFKILSQIEFPTLKVLKIEDFMTLLSSY